MYFFKTNFEMIILILLISDALGSERFKGKIDLSKPLDVNAVTSLDTKSFNYTREYGERQADGSWLALKEFCLGEHGGTHIDAPFHLFEQGWKLGDIPLDRFFTQGVVVDLSVEVSRNGSDIELERNHLKIWEKKNGVIPPKSVVFVRFGWTAGQNNLESFPGISPEAASFLVDRKVYGVGVDVPSLDRGSRKFDTHKLLLGNQIYGLENVNLPDFLPARGISLIIIPINLQFASGGPVRIIAYPKTILSSLCCNLK